MSLSLTTCVILTACGSRSHTRVATTTPELSGPGVSRLSHSVFEVVVPKRENTRIKYETPLPTHLLPFHERTDRYHIVGTAFSIDGVHLISAAHVFAVERQSFYPERMIRDSTGKIHKIAKITRYSQRRDLIEFTLASRPEGISGLPTNDKPGLGDTVYTFGNALAQGMALRKGNISSFSPEPRDGAWKYVRFSAPASPGNSGGPLLDGHGHVVGVVVMKNAEENLNFAVPLAELQKLSRARSEFLGNGRIETESGKTSTYRWKFSSRLPLSLPQLRAAAIANLSSEVVSQRRRFEARFATELFPHDRRLTTFLREQRSSTMLGVLDVNDAGEWRVDQAEYQTLLAGPEQHLYIGMHKDKLFVTMEAGNGLSIQDLYERPQHVVDAAFKHIRVNHKVASQDVRVTSYGAPLRSTSWRDQLGRPWRTSVWQGLGDNALRLSCTPYPSGVACIGDEKLATDQIAEDHYDRLNARRLSLGYDGTIADWRTYLALPARYRPTFLSGSYVRRRGDRIEFQLGDARGKVAHRTLTQKTILVADIVYHSLTPLRLRVDGVRFVSTKPGRVSLAVTRYVEASGANTAGYGRIWNNLRKKKAPFNGKVVRKDGTAQVTLLGERTSIPLAPGQRASSILVYSCVGGKDSKLSRRALRKLCRRFRSNVDVTEPPERAAAAQPR